MYSWPFTFVIVTALFFCLFVFSFYFLTNIHGTVAGVGVLLAVTLYLVCPIGVVAGVSVSLATYVFVLFLHSPGRVARAGVPLAVHPFFKPKWGGSGSWCTPGHSSFVFVVVVYTPMWDSSKSWCALGCPSFLLSLSGVVAGVGVPLATHLLFLLLLLFIHLCGTVAKAGVLLAVHLFF